jgi:hypothetical protein
MKIIKMNITINLFTRFKPDTAENKNSERPHFMDLHSKRSAKATKLTRSLIFFLCRDINAHFLNPA